MPNPEATGLSPLVKHNTLVANTAFYEFIVRRGPFSPEDLITLTRAKVDLVLLAGEQLTERAVRECLISVMEKRNDLQQMAAGENRRDGYAADAAGKGRQSTGTAGREDGSGPPVDAGAWDPAD